MTNAELATHFAKLPPNETAVVSVLDADTGIIDEEIFDLATMDMLCDINNDEFFADEGIDLIDNELSEEEEQTVADNGRQKWIGRPVIFRKS